MQVTIYIRKENEDQWSSIPDKSAAVNRMLEEMGKGYEMRTTAETVQAEVTVSKLMCRHKENKRTRACEDCGEYLG